ncbi:hypothetical protein FI667_g11585, partial [Globisporangium splendens]
MTFGNSASLQPAAIDISLFDCADLSSYDESNGSERFWRWIGVLPNNRRSKSHSPSRRSPKIKHTNGRLDEDPTTEQAATVQHHPHGNLARLQTTRVVPNRSCTAIVAKCILTSEIPKRGDIRRSITYDSPGVCPISRERPQDVSPTTRQLKIFYRDETIRQRSAENTRLMIVYAGQTLCNPETPSDQGSSNSSSPSSSPLDSDSSSGASPSSNQQKLALKALKYRKLLARASEIDDVRLKDPSFDVLECLGVKWCKV